MHSDGRPDGLCGGVRGHEVPRGFFVRAIGAGRLSHAYVLCGPEGVGKRRFAEELAAALLCRHGPLAACGSCVSCRTLASGNHPGFQRLVPEPGRTIEIDTIRALNESLALSAAERRVAILDDADRLNVAAANAFLKLLEEPPERVLFLLISSRPAHLLPTIHSRCHRVPFAPLSREDFNAALLTAGGDPPVPGWELRDAIDLHAACSGSPGRALRLLAGLEECGGLERYMQLLSGVGNERPESLVDYLPQRPGEAKRERARRLLALVLEGVWGNRHTAWGGDSGTATARTGDSHTGDSHTGDFAPRAEGRVEAETTNEALEAAVATRRVHAECALELATLIRDLEGNQNPELIIEQLAGLLPAGRRAHNLRE